MVFDLSLCSFFHITRASNILLLNFEYHPGIKAALTLIAPHFPPSRSNGYQDWALRVHRVQGLPGFPAADHMPLHSRTHVDAWCQNVSIYTYCLRLMSFPLAIWQDEMYVWFEIASFISCDTTSVHINPIVLYLWLHLTSDVTLDSFAWLFVLLRCIFSPLIMLHEISFMFCCARWRHFASDHDASGT